MARWIRGTDGEGLWIASPGCVSVLVMMAGIKGASRPFGIEQVRPLTPTTTTRERRSCPGAADKTGHKCKEELEPMPD